MNPRSQPQPAGAEAVAAPEATLPQRGRKTTSSESQTDRPDRNHRPADDHDDSPSHPHGHRHSHGHGHSHDPPPARGDLPRGAGVGQVLFLDAKSGLAGDMIVAALVDLGVPFQVVEESLARLKLEGFRVHIESGFAGAIGGSRFQVEVLGEHPERSHQAIDQLLERAELEDEVKQHARDIFLRLARAEASVHRVPVSAVHFHEVGAVDAIVDIVAAATCLSYLGADLHVSPLPLGHGSVECRHGRIPLPAPATVLCLEGAPTYAAGIEAELVTPTGAAIVGTLAGGFTRWPTFSPARVGWGLGTRRLPDRPNALRAVLGRRWSERSRPETPPSEDLTHRVLEANVDDLSGELAGHVIRQLLEAGALDAWVTPTVMKKGRPGLVISALCEPHKEAPVGYCLMSETTTIGYRKTGVARAERPRKLLDVATPFGTVPVKISGGDWGAPQLKPEFSVCAARAEEHAVPVREVLAAALAAARALATQGGAQVPRSGA